MNVVARFSRSGYFPLAVVIGLATLTSACASTSDKTTGKRISLATKISAGTEARTPFTNSQGWNISLSKVVLSTGALYYFEGATIFSVAPVTRTSRWAQLWDYVAIRNANAHPGHYIPGNARGEMLSSASVDLHAGEAALPNGEGVTGTVRSATFSYQSPATGSFATELGPHVAVLEGVAKKGTDTRPFRAEIDASDLLNTRDTPSVEGCPFIEAEIEADGTVTVNIKLALWFDQVEFGTVPKSDDGTPVRIPETAIARNELVRGMKAGDGYVFTFSR